MPVDHEQEESRIRSVYASRDLSGRRTLYAWHRQEVLFNLYRFQAVAAALLSAEGLTDLSHLEILDVGCGTGGWLRKLLEWGASANRLHGIDLLPDRIQKAQDLGTGINFQTASGYAIPRPDATMDLVSAHTVFSSILDENARNALAGEIIRVLKPGGRILIYDYRISDPRNPDTIGIGKAEICRLFPGLAVKRRTLTLAPPIARRLAHYSPLLVHTLEAFIPFLRTHALYLIGG